MSDTKLVNNSQVKHALKINGIVGDIVARLAMKVTGLNKMNDIYSNISRYKGVEFAQKLIEYLNVECDFLPDELKNIPTEGPAILVSNHPFGAIDGIMMLAIVGKLRPDLKILTNFLLSYIPNLQEYFLPVNPFTDRPGLKSSLKGLKLAKENLVNGGILGLFPSGEVSSSGNKEKVVKDIPWQPSIIKLIRNAGVPVIPVYFHGGNSKFFHFIGKVNPLLRTVRLPHELANKHDKTISIRFGKPVSVSEIAEYTSDAELGAYLYNRTYALESEICSGDCAKSKDKESATEYTIPVAEPIDRKLITQELGKLSTHKLFDTAGYECYLCDSSQIPNMMHEIGRVREETFRAVGEGTNKALDTDDYDTYYKQMFLWNKENNELVGAYRIGLGNEIYADRGIKGFYTDTLFRYKREMSYYLSHSIELGRSFVSVKYQKEALPLMLLIKGVMYTVLRYPNIRYLLGPVSISASYPLFYRSLMIYYLKNRQALWELKHNIRPIHPFKEEFYRVNPSDLLYGKMDSLEKFDRFIFKLSDGKYRLPTLLKRYIKINAKIIDYNVDPDFSYCVDGLIMLNLSEVPRLEIELLSKEFTDKSEIYRRFDISVTD